MTFGEKLKALRLSRGMSAKQLGKLAGVSDKSISNYEKGINIPRDKVCEALAKELGVSLKELTDLITNYDKKPVPAGKEEKKAKKVAEKAKGSVKNVQKAGKKVTLINGVKNTKPVVVPEELVKATVSQKGVDKAFDVISLVSQMCVLLSGDEISRKEKDAIMLALNGAYWNGR